MEAMFKEILHELKNVNSRLDSMDTRLDSLEQGQLVLHQDLAELKDSQTSLVKDLVGSFGQFNNEIEIFAEDRTEALNQRVYNAEVEIKKINRILKIS